MSESEHDDVASPTRADRSMVFCKVCRLRIAWRYGKWVHHVDNLPYGSIGGPHWATPADGGASKT